MQAVVYKRALVLVLLTVGVICQGQTTEVGTQADGQSTLVPAQAQSMVLGPGDVVNINVSNSAEFTMKVRVDAAGNVAIPYLGTQHFQGKTVEEVQALLTRLLKEQQYFSDPEVLVFVEQYTNQTISVLGEVNKPGVFPGIGEHTLYELLSAAGGFTQYASQHVLIYRRN